MSNTNKPRIITATPTGINRTDGSDRAGDDAANIKGSEVQPSTSSISNDQPVLKVWRTSLEVRLPEYAHEGDIGLDIRAVGLWTGWITPGELLTIDTGLFVAIPEGHYGRIAPRSGLSAQGLMVLGGVIDPGYRGELKVVVVNLGREIIELTNGGKIAQLILERASRVKVEEEKTVEDLGKTERGDKGFGSSGQ